MTTLSIIAFSLLVLLFLIGILPGLPGHGVWKSRPVLMTSLAVVLFALGVLFRMLA